MTAQTAASAAYIVAALLFILALAGLSRHETARAGNTFGIAGMAIALVATLVLAIAGSIDGAPVGLLIGRDGHRRRDRAVPRARVAMTGMPELIALLHSFVGLAAVLVGWNGYLEVEAHGGGGRRAADLLGIHHAEVFIGVFIGAVTFTGSIVAFLKLSARIKSAPLVLPGKNVAQPRRAASRSPALHRSGSSSPRRSGVLIAVTVDRAGARAGTSSPRSAAATCPSSCRCSTATPAGPRPRRASCSTTTC